MKVQFKGSYKGAQRKLNINRDHISMVFNRDKRVVLRMMDGLEVALDDEYEDADSVAEEIWPSDGAIAPAVEEEAEE